MANTPGSRVRAVLPFIGLIVVSALTEAAPVDGNTQIAAEVDRIERAWKNSVPSPGSPLAGLASGTQASLKAAREALSSGRPYVALERLAQAADMLRGVQAFAEKSDAVKDLPAFEAEWGKANERIATLSREVGASNWHAAPAAVRALADTSMGRSVPLLDGGRGFATTTSPKEGMFYLGEARGQAEFAAFCASLRLRRDGRPRPMRSLLPELLALQANVDAAFVPPRSIEQHPRFIALNSAIKLARELDAGKLYYGALYQYLDAVRQFGMLDAAEVQAEQQESLNRAVAAERARVANSGMDDSILAILLERAESPTNADEWRSAAVTLKQVAAAYAAVLKSVPAIEARSGKTIDVTLVRWPYT